MVVLNQNHSNTITKNLTVIFIRIFSSLYRLGSLNCFSMAPDTVNPPFSVLVKCAKAHTPSFTNTQDRCHFGWEWEWSWFWFCVLLLFLCFSSIIMLHLKYQHKLSFFYTGLSLWECLSLCINLETSPSKASRDAERWWRERVERHTLEMTFSEMKTRVNYKDMPMWMI